MKKDWVIWLSCFCLFGAGAVWAQIPIGTNFFVVSDVHDLFEIFASIATVIAVGIAAVGVNAWKAQVRATADHELARKVAVILSKYRDAVISVWSSAESSCAQVTSKETLSPLMKEVLISLMQTRVDSAEAARVDMQGVVLECKAVWGDGFFTGLSEVIALEEEFSNCTRSYISLIKVQDNPLSSILRRNELKKVGTKMKDMNLSTHDEMTHHLDSLLGPISSGVQEKLLK